MKHFPLFLAALFLLPGPALFSMNWPSPSGVMTRNFGWNDGGGPHLGVSFADNGVLAAVEAGELLFKHREGNTASRLPSPLGAWVALDHGDGLISIYSRFNNASLSEIPYRVEQGAVLGQAGISGWASQNGFYFQLFDRKESRWVNPSVIIRTMNPRIPVITQVSLMDSQGRLFNLAQTSSITQGRYTVLVNAITGPFNAPLAPFRIISSLNGAQAGALNFETYFVRDGSLVVYRNGLIPVRRVYAPVSGYEVADVWLTRGQATLEIIAQDISGVTRNVVHRFTVE
ncbi:MAG: peptidoglycan DD-metalloendopeptidase family protein [Treponema sp.]|nr:peptidoglycan DD-metalloendopeptidase family protein [Treponema sp.]